jgi:hypothetical protein
MLGPPEVQIRNEVRHALVPLKFGNPLVSRGPARSEWLVMLGKGR